MQDELIDACLSLHTALHCVVATIDVHCSSQHYAHWLQSSVTWHHWWIFITALRVGGMTTREVRRSLSTKYVDWRRWDHVTAVSQPPTPRSLHVGKLQQPRRAGCCGGTWTYCSLSLSTFTPTSVSLHWLTCRCVENAQTDRRRLRESETAVWRWLLVDLDVDVVSASQCRSGITQCHSVHCT